MKVKLVLFLAALAVLGTACGSKDSSQAMGPNDVITVVADSAEFELLREDLQNALGRTLFTPQPETWFDLRRIDMLDLPNHKRDRNVVILSPIDAKHDEGDLIRSSLSKDVQALVREGKEHAFVKRDLWYKNQTVLYLTGASLQGMQDFMVNNALKLHYYFKNAWDERERDMLLTLPREATIEERLWEKHGWSPAVIKGWRLAIDTSNVAWLRRETPMGAERWILVHWIDTTATDLLNPRFHLALRNRLTEKYYRTVDDKAYVVVDTVNHLQFDEANFDGLYAARVQGLWHMSDWSMGGPFVSYLLYYEPHRRIYILDGSVFAPKYEKKKLIQDCDVMLQTIRFDSTRTTKPPA